MSNQSNKPDGNFRPESQADRWIKYGSNVLLSVILVIALGIGLIWFAQHTDARKDMTLNGSLSLKPQTAAVLKDLKQHITLVSLYVRPSDKPDDVAQAQRVSDLLDEYKDKSSNIDVKIIDPAKEKDKLEDLHQDFINRYGKSIKGYKDYLESWQKTYSEVKKLTDAEATGVAPFNTPGLGQQDEVMQEIVSTLSDEVPQGLEDARKAVDHELRQKHPDYKGAAATAKGVMEKLSQLSGQLAELAPKAQETTRLPPEFKKYMLNSMPHFQEIKKIADESVAAGGKLGELKVDQLEQALTVDNPILVLGDSDWRILQQDQVWQPDTDVHAAAATGKTKPRFAGEQQVTTAIFGLENPVKKKVCFVRSGGEPVTQHGFMGFTPNGAMSVIADRLREYNFDVTEKDFSGMSAMRAQMQGMPTPPEPTDEQIKDAIWIVLDVPQPQQQQQQMPTPPLGPKVKQHLEEGGSALILPEVGGDKLEDALKNWGVELRTDAIGVHEKVAVEGTANTDPLERAKGQPLVWDIRDYGDHPLATPIKNLDAIFYIPTVVRTTSAKGCTITPLIPLTMNGAKVWGETDLESVDKQTMEYNADKDLAPPIFAGAAVEKQGAGRLVVIGSMRSMTDFFMHVWDPTLYNRDPRVYVNRSPGNGELFANSMFWLAHLEPMIAISPSAMDVPRIDDMSDGMLRFWKIGVLMILLPGIVLAAGAFVYVSRRD